LSPTLIATCSRHGHIRKYDISGKSRRSLRPVAELLWIHQEEPATCTAIVAINEHEVLVGGATGALVHCDFRKARYTPRGYPLPLRGILRKYRGSVGAIKELSYSNGYIGAVGLDRFLRVYKYGKIGLAKNEPVYQVYLKSKLMGVTLMPGFDPQYVDPNEAKKDKENAVVQVVDPLDKEKNEEESIEVIIANTRLEQLLSLPTHKYKNKKHPFYKFFLKTADLRKTLKTTDADEVRDTALELIREKFVAFKNAAAIRSLCDGEEEPDLEEMVPRKKRKYD
jgi:hypothetical protein